MIEAILFYMFSVFAVGCGLAILFSRNIVRMAYWLIGMLMAVAGIYFLIGAYFLGVIQVIVYVGGVAVLVVFGVMLTSRQMANRLIPRSWEVVWLTMVAAILLAGFILTFLRTRWSESAEIASNSIQEIGIFLLSNFVGPFELASVLLLMVLMGAAYLARPKVPQIGPKEMKVGAKS